MVQIGYRERKALILFAQSVRLYGARCGEWILKTLDKFDKTPVSNFFVKPLIKKIKFVKTHGALKN